MASVLTIDVEDWYQGLEVPTDRWSRFAKRVERDTHVVLDLLDSHETRATFLFLGRVASAYPALVREVAQRGHEVGSHGHVHAFAYLQGRETFRRDLRYSLDTLRQCLGRDVASYRAPFFSVTRRTPWFFDVLAEEGIRYDSSLFPVHNYRYGIPTAPTRPFRVRTEAGPVAEYPISTVRVLGLNVPFGGGFYLRFWPYWLVRAAARKVAAAGWPLVFYLHPWELSAGASFPREIPWRIRTTHHYGRERAAWKVDRLLRDFRFAPLGEVARACGDPPEAPPGWAVDLTPADPFDPLLGDLTRSSIARVEGAPGRRVLDLGCGTGVCAFPLAASGARVVAVDASEERLRSARERARALGLEEKIRFAAMDVHSLALKGGCVDGIHSRSVLQYTDRPRVLDECRRVLAPGGRFSFAEVLEHNPFARLYRTLARGGGRGKKDPLIRPRSHLPYARIADVDLVGAGIVHSEFVLVGYLAWTALVVLRSPRLFALLGACSRRLDGWILDRFPPLRRFAWMTVISGPTPREDRTTQLSRPPSLLIVSQVFPPDIGAYRMIYECGRALARRGHAVEALAAVPHYPSGIVTAAYRGRLLTREERGGLPVTRLRILTASNKQPRRRLVSFLSFLFAASLHGSLRRAPARDVILGVSPPLFAGLAAWFIAAVRRRPFVLYLLDLEPESAIAVGHYAPRSPIVRFARRLSDFLYSRAAAVIAFSEGARRVLVEDRRLPEEKVALVTAGVDTDLFAPRDPDERLRRELLEGGSFLVLYTGTIGRIHALETLVEAAAQLRDRPDVRFAVVGDGERRAALEELARAKGLDAVRFLGPRPTEEIPALIAAADLCVTTTKRAALHEQVLPAKVFEYMAAGRPVLLGMEGECVDLVVGAGAGIAVPSEAPAALASAIRALAVESTTQGPGRLRSMGEAGRKLVLDRFSMERAADTLAGVLSRACAAEGTRRAKARRE